MTSLLTVESCSSSTVPPLPSFSSSLVWCVCRPRAPELWSCLSATFCLNRQLQMGVDGGTIVSLWSVLQERLCDECLSSGVKLHFSHAESRARGFTRLVSQKGRVLAGLPWSLPPTVGYVDGASGSSGAKGQLCKYRESITHLREKTFFSLRHTVKKN